VKDTRPVNLNLILFKWPLPALISILHRISGVALFFGTAILLYLLQLSLESQAGFDLALEIVASTAGKIILWLIVAALAYHLIAGVKHLLMDMGIGETREGARTGATVTLVLFLISAVLAGVWLW
jgi:succinate dehydrogenase / fumarate reductase cytochrome b subunit